MVELSFKSMSVLELRQVGTFSFYNMLGNIGGVLGLFLGASLFTMCDVLQYLCKQCQRYAEEKGVGRETEPKRILLQHETKPQIMGLQHKAGPPNTLTSRIAPGIEGQGGEIVTSKVDKRKLDKKRDTFYSVEGFSPEYDIGTVEENKRDTFYTADEGDLEGEITELYY